MWITNIIPGDLKEGLDISEPTCCKDCDVSEPAGTACCCFIPQLDRFIPAGYKCANGIHLGRFSMKCPPYTGTGTERDKTEARMRETRYPQHHGLGPLRLITLGLQMAQCRYCLYTLGPNVGIMYRHGVQGKIEAKQMMGHRKVSLWENQLEPRLRKWNKKAGFLLLLGLSVHTNYKISTLYGRGEVGLPMSRHDPVAWERRLKPVQQC